MTQERWNTFSKHDQLLHIASELTRAEQWQKKNNAEYVRLMLERAIALVDLSIDDPKWSENLTSCLVLRDAIQEFHDGTKTGDIGALVRAL